MKKIHLNKEVKETVPSLFLVTLQAVKEQAAIMYTNYVVAYEPDTAIDIVTQILQTKDEKIYKEGLKLGEWQYRQLHQIPVTKLEEMFNDVGRATKEAKATQRKEIKNNLMATILENKDAELLQENVDLFTVAEQQFLHDKIIC